MALARAVQGAKRPSQLITWSDEDGNAVDLTGAIIAARLRNSGGTTRASDGTFTITNAAGGIFRWDYGTADVATADTFAVQFTATFSSAPTPARSLVADWIVLEAI